MQRFEGPPERDHLTQRSGHALGERLDQGGHQLGASGAVGFAVGGDHPLVGPPGRSSPLLTAARYELSPFAAPGRGTSVSIDALGDAMN